MLSYCGIETKKKRKEMQKMNRLHWGHFVMSYVKITFLELIHIISSPTHSIGNSLKKKKYMQMGSCKLQNYFFYIDNALLNIYVRIFAPQMQLSLAHVVFLRCHLLSHTAIQKKAWQCATKRVYFFSFSDLFLFKTLGSNFRHS